MEWFFHAKGRPGIRVWPVWGVRLLIVLAACLCSLSLEWLRPPLVERADEGLRDFALRLTASEQPETRIAIIDIDEASLRALGPWPWPRSRLAELVERLLSDYGARTVSLDMVLPEAQDPGGDARLASLAQHGPLVLAQILDYTARTPPLAQGQLSAGWPVPQPRANATRGPAAATAQGYIANQAGFAEARCVGNIGFRPDADGQLRRLPLLSRFAGRDYPHLAVAILNCAAADTQPTRLMQLVQQTPAQWRIPYEYALSAYTVIPAQAVLGAPLDEQLLRGRHVLIGASALSLGDRVSTPLAALTSGVMVHAASLSALLDIEAGRLRLPWSGRVGVVAWVLAAMSLGGLFIVRQRAWLSALGLTSLALLWLFIALYGALQQAEWSITAPLWGTLLLLLLGVPHELWRAQLQVRRAINTLAHYVSRPVLDEILRANLHHSLQPSLREVTVLIADIEGYTRLTNTLPLADAARLTTDILECLTQPLLAAGGTLDRYSGDGLVAFWGAPLDCPAQADLAVETALTMQERVALYNQSRPAGLPVIRVRIGIESGPALVGDLGTSFRSTYTAVGDCINFASRLESAARDQASRLLIGPCAQAGLARLRARVVSAGRLQLRGTERPIDVYTVAAADPSLSATIAAPGALSADSSRSFE
ncbi:MAG: adenylate/guanylate cyclase domain-containing protein [Castellaniella sp.]|nr:adenylate/guanylate cyclase domain-containing protein [Castellaniella sp.]